METRPVTFNPRYRVSACGRVFGPRGNELKPQPHQKLGHLYVAFWMERGRILRRGVHQVVLTAWGPPKPPGKVVTRHLNGDQTDNRIENLAWGTYKDNEDDKLRHGRLYGGARHHSARVTPEQVSRIRELYAAGKHTLEQLAAMFGLTRTPVHKIVRRKSWKYVA